MLSLNEIYSIKQFYKNFMKKENRLSLEQEKNIDGVQIKAEPLNILSAATYHIQNNTVVLNSNFNNYFLALYMLFHELDHVRTVYCANGKRLTGIFSQKDTSIFVTNNGTGLEFLEIIKGIMLTEGATAINGEKVFRSYNGSQNWQSEVMSKTDNNIFPGHEFPSSLYTYKLNGNFVAQTAAVLGITESELCKIIDKNQLGRDELIERFYNLTGNENEFENIEERMDLVATIFKGVLKGLDMNENTREMCDYNIIQSQRMLADSLLVGFTKKFINEEDFLWRIERFSKFLTKPGLREEIIKKIPEEIKKTI